MPQLKQEDGKQGEQIISKHKIDKLKNKPKELVEHNFKKSKLQNLKFKYFQDKGTVNTVIAGNFADTYQAKLIHQQLNNAVTLALEGPQWDLNFDVNSKDIYGKYKWSLDKSSKTSLSIYQQIPKCKFNAVPAPELLMETQMFKNEYIDERFDFKYDFSSRKAGVKATLKQKNSKVEAWMDSKKGLEGSEFKLTQDFKNQYLKQMSIGCGKIAGLYSKAHFKFGKGNQVVASTDFNKQIIGLEYKITPQQIADQKLSIILKGVKKNFDFKKFNPGIIAEINWDF